MIQTFTFIIFLGLVAVQMEKLQLVPQMKVVKKTRTVKMVLLDAVLMEELGPRDLISRVALNVLRRYVFSELVVGKMYSTFLCVIPEIFSNYFLM